MKHVFSVDSPGDLGQAVDCLKTLLQKHHIVCFYGEMGAGKTTFIQALLKSMGAGDEVSSPTFSIVNEYPVAGALVYHFDFYRLNTLQDALNIGVEEYLESGAICFMEWPQLVESILPKTRLEVNIKDEGEFRTIEMGEVMK
jgi:tRNA threonylcarbamoyladenosine biosynthesis protein TsaE